MASRRGPGWLAAKVGAEAEATATAEAEAASARRQPKPRTRLRNHGKPSQTERLLPGGPQLLAGLAATQLAPQLQRRQKRGAGHDGGGCRVCGPRHEPGCPDLQAGFSEIPLYDAQGALDFPYQVCRAGCALDCQPRDSALAPEAHQPAVPPLTCLREHSKAAGNPNCLHQDGPCLVLGGEVAQQQRVAA